MLKRETTAFVFPGQGSQAVGMGLDFYNNFNTAKQVFEEVDDVLSYKLSKIIFEGSEAELKQTQNTQSALMAVSIAIIKVMEEETGRKAYEISSVMAGHSLGEYSALCAAGSISVKQAAMLLKNRGQFMADATQGSMIALIGMEDEKIKSLIEKAKEGEVLVVANDNSIGQVVLSGNIGAIERANSIAKEYGAKMAIKLDVSGAFHSPLLEEASLKMKQVLEGIEFGEVKCTVLNNVNTLPYETSTQIKSLLTQQITSPVRWKDAMLKMEAIGIEVAVEVGSGKVLSGLFKRTAKNIKTFNISNIVEFKEFLNNL